MSAVKWVYKLIADRHNKGEDTTSISVLDLINQHDLWLADEWTHVGYCVVACLDNPKLITSYHSGNHKVLDVLVGKTIKAANMTVEPTLIKELMSLIIERHFNVGASNDDRG